MTLEYLRTYETSNFEELEKRIEIFQSLPSLKKKEVQSQCTILEHSRNIRTHSEIVKLALLQDCDYPHLDAAID